MENSNPIPLRRRTDELKVWPASQFKPDDLVLDKTQGENLKITAIELETELNGVRAEIKRLRRALHLIADSLPDEYMDVEKAPERVKWICETCRSAGAGAYPPDNTKDQANPVEQPNPSEQPEEAHPFVSDTPETDAVLVDGMPEPEEWPHQYLKLVIHSRRMERERNTARIPICIGRPLIEILAEQGMWTSMNGNSVGAADCLFGKNPYINNTTI